MSSVVLACLPPLRDDQNTGRCRLDSGLFKTLGVRVGDPVVVKSQEGESLCLCSAWPLPQAHGAGLTLVDPLVRPFGNTASLPETVTVEPAGSHAPPAQRLVVQLERAATAEPITPLQKAQIRNLLLRVILSSGCVLGTQESAKVRVVSTAPAGLVQVCAATEISITEAPPAPAAATRGSAAAASAASLPPTVDHGAAAAAVDPIADSLSRLQLDDAAAAADRAAVETDPLGGLEEAADALREMISLPLMHPEVFRHLGIECPKGILIKGPPGVGKTLLVKTVTHECAVKLVTINGPEIFGPYIGDTERALREVFESASKHRGPCVIFVDEIDALCPPRSSASSHESRVVAQMLTLMDGMVNRGRLVVVAATNRPNHIDPALRRPGRFDREIEIGVPTLAQRTRVLRALTRRLPLDPLVDLDAVSAMLPGYVAADLAALCLEASHSALRRHRAAGAEAPGASAAEPAAMTVTMADFLHASSCVRATSQRDTAVEFTKTSWSDIGGIEDVKRRLRQAVEWPLQHPEAFRRLGLSPPKGVLLWGPPGCSKTTLVKAIATSVQATFLSLSGASIYSPFLGDAEAAVRDIFRKARLGSPSIIFFDEIDALVGKRALGEEGGSGVQERVLATLLNEMDGIELAKDVLVVAATNRPDMLDPALLRPGRMDTQLYVPPPDAAGRLQILQIYTRSTPLASDVDLQSIAQQTDLCTGADLQSLCREAALLALREDLESTCVRMAHFQQAMTTVKPTLLDYKRPAF